jgi:hypothetical protein
MYCIDMISPKPCSLFFCTYLLSFLFCQMGLWWVWKVRYSFYGSYDNLDALNITDLTTCLLYRLGHREQKDEWKPRLVEIFQRHNVLPPNAIVSAGSASSACTAGMIQLSLVHTLSYNAFRV